MSYGSHIDAIVLPSYVLARHRQTDYIAKNGFNPFLAMLCPKSSFPETAQHYPIGIAMQQSNTILRLPQTIEKTGLSRSTIYALISRGEFVTKIKLSPRTMGFLESEVDAWILGRLNASRVA